MTRTWRRWASPITLLLLLGLLGWGLWWGWEQLTRPPQDTTPPCVPQSASVLTSDQVTVTVLNAGRIPGLAGQVSEQLRNKGFVMRAPGNTDEPVSNTVIVGGSADEPPVQLVSGFFPGAEIWPDERTDGTVDVLVGDAFDGFDDEAPTEIGVPGGSVCLPETSRPTEDAGAAQP